MTAAPKTILFVSDHLHIYEGVITHLKVLGCNVIQAEDAILAEEEIKKLAKTNVKVDAIVTDIHMGGNFQYPGSESGLALAKKLRSGEIVPYGNDIYLIASTADPSFHNRPEAKLFSKVTGMDNGKWLLSLLTEALDNLAPPPPEKPQIIVAGCYHPNLRRVLQQMIESEGGEMRWAATHEALIDHIVKSGSQLSLIISQFDDSNQCKTVNMVDATSAMHLDVFAERIPEILIVAPDDGDLYVFDDLMRMSLQSPDGWTQLMNGIVAAIHGMPLTYDTLNKTSHDSVEVTQHVREKLAQDGTLRQILSHGAQAWADRTSGKTNIETNTGSPNV